MLTRCDVSVNVSKQVNKQVSKQINDNKVGIAIMYKADIKLNLKWNSVSIAPYDDRELIEYKYEYRRLC